MFGRVEVSSASEPRAIAKEHTGDAA